MAEKIREMFTDNEWNAFIVAAKNDGEEVEDYPVRIRPDADLEGKCDERNS